MERDNKGRFVKGHSEGNRFVKGEIPWNKGKIYSNGSKGYIPTKETRRKISESKRGTMKGKKIEKDLERQKNIQQELNCKFLRIGGD